MTSQIVIYLGYIQPPSKIFFFFFFFDKVITILALQNASCQV